MTGYGALRTAHAREGGWTKCTYVSSTAYPFCMVLESLTQVHKKQYAKTAGIAHRHNRRHNRDRIDILRTLIS